MEASKIHTENDQQRNISLWKNSNFLLLWGANVTSLFGLQVYMIVMPLIIYDLSKSALAMSTMRMIEILPNILLGIVAGVIVDRLSRKKIMTVTVVFQWLSIAGILLLLLFQGIQLWSLFLLGFIFSSSGYFFLNAYHSSIPQLISKEQLTDANAKFSFVDTMIRMIGPGIVGFVLAATSFQKTVSIQLICISAMFVLIRLIKVPLVDQKGKQNSFWIDVKEGIMELIGNKVLLTPTVAILLINLSSSIIIGILLFFAVDIIGVSESEVGLMLSLGAIGGLFGALLLKKLVRHFPRGKIFTYVLVFEFIGYGILVFANSWLVIGMALAIRTFAVTIVNIIYLAFRQEFTPNHLLGRVAGTTSMLMKLAMPVGFLFAGLWAEWLPVRHLFVLTTIIVSLIFISLFRTRFYNIA
ncbi:MFS transporter (plasmid) [Alkalihalophilus pseudofirmus]|uniref:MFS transporter n=1 Tax=Alkalihalophilus pseudofirmus TaxID=79885 RepID=UPI00259B2F8E|nr:MFS transporter [Alkalihalophilus pseudofirmus]WEG19257.1 MFS transporter [Alkalihalophilus pseudofirmus]